MIIVAIAAGLVAGYLVGHRAPRPRQRAAPRPVKLGATAQTARPLADVIETVRAAALWVEPRADGFNLVDQLAGDGEPDRLIIRVADPSAVTVATITCGNTSSLDLPFQLALALVPLYGPLTLVLDSGIYEVDGTKDSHALMRELSRRQTARMREVLARRAPLALLVLALVPRVAAAEPWPAKGRCITPWPSKSACIQVSPADAKAIQTLMIAYAEKRGDRKAKTFAQRPITDGFIGPFAITGYEIADFTGDTLELVAVEETRSGTETGFRYVVGRITPKAAWQVLHFEHYRKKLPRLN